MQYEVTIEIRGVTVIQQTDLALLCQMGNQHRWIAATQFQPGSTVTRQGRRRDDRAQAALRRRARLGPSPGAS